MQYLPTWCWENTVEPEAQVEPILSTVCSDEICMFETGATCTVK